jgi:hypothetical protein
MRVADCNGELREVLITPILPAWVRCARSPIHSLCSSIAYTVNSKENCKKDFLNHPSHHIEYSCLQLKSLRQTMDLASQEPNSSPMFIYSLYREQQGDCKKVMPNTLPITPNLPACS